MQQQTSMPQAEPRYNMLDLHTIMGQTKNRLSRMWQMIQGYRTRYVTATVFLGFAAMLQTGRSLLLQYLVDDVLIAQVSNLMQMLILVALGFVLLAFFQGVFTFFSGIMAGQTGEGIAQRLRNYLYDHIQRLSFAYHDVTKTGDLIQRSTSDVDTVRRFLAEEALGFGRIVMIFSVNFIVLLLLHWPLALVSVIIVPIVTVASLLFFRRVEKAYESFQDQESKLSSRLQESLSGTRVVKAFARQDYERAKFETENREKLKRGVFFMMHHAIFWPSTDLLTAVQLLGGYTIAALMVIDGTITVGTYLAYASILVWIIFPVRELGRLIVQISTGLVSLERVTEVIREEREVLGQDDTPPLRTIEGTVRFDAVNFEYLKDHPVLHDITFEAKAGQKVALLGSTGSGKTSLVSLLPRFYDYTSGSITIDGVELRNLPRYFLRKHIGIVEQEPFLFSRTMRDNIAYGVDHEVTDEEVFAAAKAAAIHDTILSFPEGYQTLIGEKGVTLSGGQKQRVALARTILKNPRILILDDATSSVDTETESQIREALEGLMQARTTFIIAHRIQTVMYADLILVLDKGRIVQRGTHAELLNQEGIYRRIYEIQARIETELEEEIASV
ncbi:MAG: ABC transporter ATP-binding protein [bacterium]|nr:ABC transporter ATP-binding protein [bacterium]